MRSIKAILPNCDVRVMEGIIACLGRKGIPIVALGTKRDCSAFRSRYVARKFISPSSKDETRFLNFLVDAVPKGVLFASDDHTALLFSKQRDSLTRSGFLMNFPSQDSLETGFDKWRCYLKATELGIPCAATKLINGSDDLVDIAKSVPFPFIIKATTLAGGNYVRVETREDIVPAYDKMSALVSKPENNPLKPRLMAQEWLDYRMEDIWCVEAYYDQNGKARGFFPIRKIRTVIYREGTYGSRLYAGESVPNKSLENLTLRLLSGLEWKGIAHVDWVYCASRNQYYLTEINPRLPGFSFFPSEVGFEMAYYYYSDLIGERFDCPAVKPALYFEIFRYPGDLTSSLVAIWRRQYSLSKLMKSYLRIFIEKKPTKFDYFNTCDMKMTIYNFFQIVIAVTKDALHILKRKSAVIVFLGVSLLRNNHSLFR